MDEKRVCLYVAAKALSLGRGRISRVCRATGVSRLTITAGCKELRAGKGSRQSANESRRSRKPGGGRKRTVAIDTILQHDLESLIEPVMRGDPESPLRWTCKSVRKLADDLKGLHILTVMRRLSIFGVIGERLKLMAQGIDDSPVIPLEAGSRCQVGWTQYDP